MKRFYIFNTYHWIVLLAGVVLSALVILQARYILEAHQLKEAQIHQRMRDLAEPIAVEAKIDVREILEQSEENWQLLRTLIDTMAVEAGFEPGMPFAILQHKEGGLFQSQDHQFEAALRASPYQACLNCVITIQFLNDSTRLPETEFTSMRPVAETET
ncbi:MAG: hypothetical protein AAFQ68_13295, partial [Bacteroidota bacterium]